MTPAMPEYLWLVICGAFAAFGFGWATGANDVANAFGTSVGAKTITLRQAVLIAAVFEFGGAMLLGRTVTNTIAGGIADPSVFARQPEIYAYGMVCALTVGFLWQGWASWQGYNVSATHSIIGGIIGFALCFAGGGAVQWATPDPAAFPPYKGVVPIVMSWFFSPVLTGAASACIFGIVRTLVMRRANARHLVLWILPVAVLITVFINIFFVFTKGAAKTLGNTWPTTKAAWVSALIAAGCAFVTAVAIVPLLRWKLARRMLDIEARNAQHAIDVKMPKTELEALDEEGGQQGGARSLKKAESWAHKLVKQASSAALYGTSVDIHAAVEEDGFIAALHARAENFDEHAEYAFGYLQVFSAVCVVFAHGAGEVGFMAGPLSAIYDVYRNGVLTAALQPQVWCVLIGAASLVIGLATYGYNVTRAMGVQMAKLSPSRGFAAELSTSLVILVASQLGLPTSSSQCITGGIVGVGLMEGFRGGVNWRFFGKQFASWVATLFVAGLGVAALFAQGIYTPSKVDGGQVLAYEDGLSRITGNVVGGFNGSLQALQAAAGSSNGTLAPAAWADVNASLAGVYAHNAALTATKDDTNIRPQQALDALTEALALVQNNSVFSLGQRRVFPGALGVCNDAAGAPAACVSPPLVAAP